MLGKLLKKIWNSPSSLHNKISPTINRYLFRASGIRFGQNMSVMGRVHVYGLGHITIGENFIMTSGNAINPISSNFQGCFYTETPESKIVIGNNVGMSSTRMWIHDSLTIGNNVQIGANVLLIDTDTHQIDYKLRRSPEDAVFAGLTTDEIWKKKRENTKSASIVIEDDVWIGAHTIVLKGVTIGARSIIGAGSIVTKSIPADCIAAGNPCRVIRMLSHG